MGGGGICCFYSSPVLENININNNSADSKGGGIYCFYSHPQLQNLALFSNSASNGGGIYCHHSNPQIQNVSISNNLAYSKGGGIYCHMKSNPVLINCILWNAITDNVYFSSNNTPNTITISYSDIQGDSAGIITNNNGTVNWLEGNIDIDPLFCGFGEDPCALRNISPCIDAGTPDTAGLNLPFWDIIGNDRFVDGDGDGVAVVDMGAYEYPGAFVNIKELTTHQLPLTIHNYPNPSSGISHIRYNLTADCRLSTVDLRVFDIKGKEIRMLVNEEQNAGEYTVLFDGSDLPAGIYLIKLHAGEYSETVKIIIMR